MSTSGIAEMSRISNRLATVAAALIIVLLVILLVILWSDVRNIDRIETLDRIRKNSTVYYNETRRKQYNFTTIPLITMLTSSTEQNFTNEGEFSI